MPSRHFIHRDSWPPTILHLGNNNLNHNNNTNNDDIADTDDNPFSYFLEPSLPSDIDIDIDADDDVDDVYLDLSAGIETSDSKMQKVREVSPSSLQRLPILSAEELAAEAEAEQAEADAHSDDLRDWLAVPLPPRSPTRRRSDRVVTGGALNMKGRAAAAARGRGLMRSGGGGVYSTGPVTRSRSAGSWRGRAWREPSPEIGVIAEEGEDVEMVDSPGSVESAVGDDVSGPGMGTATGGKKLRKRVHWATPVERRVID